MFSLDYAVDPPLTAVVHIDSINRYRVAFHMLWRLKRVEWALSGSWKQLMCFNHTRGASLLHTQIYSYIFIYTYLYMLIHAYTYSYIHTYIHTHLYIHTF